MATHNANNVRIVHRYIQYLKEAQRYSESSVDSAAAAIDRFDTWNKHRDFRRFHIDQAVHFKRHLGEQRNRQTGAMLSKATAHATLAHLKRFFFWLAGQPSYKSRLKYSDADYFNDSAKDARVAAARRELPFPTLEQVHRVLDRMPADTDIQRRDRAVMAFTILTGARDGATASLKLKHVDMEAGLVRMDARDVATKFSKTFVTHFFPVGGQARDILAGWVALLRNERGWGLEDPLFPATEVAPDESRCFAAHGLARRGWSSAEPIRGIFRKAFGLANLPYFRPHSFRHTLVMHAHRMCRTPEELKAWSQNLGHEDVLTTLYSYGAVAVPRQAEIMRGMAQSSKERRGSDLDALADMFEQWLKARSIGPGGGSNLPSA